MRLAATGTAAPTGQSATEGVGWLGLAATPAFAVMAWVTALAPPGMCTAALSWAPVNDMALMYFLMSLFHLTPWLRALSHHLTAPHRPN